MHSQPTLFRMPEARRCSLCHAPFGRPTPTCCKCQLRRDPLPPEGPDPLRDARVAAERAAAAARLERLRALGRPVRVALVGCGKSKLEGEHPARQLYTGALTRLALTYGERIADEAWILSALYGLLHPDRLVESYDKRLSTRSDERQCWQQGVRTSLHNAYPGLPLHLIVLAGRDYAAAITSYDSTWSAEFPLEGLQLGHRLSWLARHLHAHSP